MGCGATTGKQMPEDASMEQLPLSRNCAEGRHAVATDVVRESPVSQPATSIVYVNRGLQAEHPREISANEGEWQLEDVPGKWCPLPQEVSDQLLRAYYSGESKTLYADGRASVEVDFSTCMQTNWQSGVKQRIKWAQRTSGAVNNSGGNLNSSISGGYFGETRYQWQMKNGAWVDYDDDEQSYLLAAWAAGKDVAQYRNRDLDYRVDFVMMVQTIVTTDQKRLVRVRPTGQSNAEVSLQPVLAQLSMAPREQTHRGPGRDQPQTNLPTGPCKPPAPGHGPGGMADGVHKKKWSLGGSAGGGRQTVPLKAADTAERENDTPIVEEATAEEPVFLPELPQGVLWPQDLHAQNASAEVFATLAAAKKQSKDLGPVYRSLCLRWHPDKNLHQEDLATEVFQFLQALRSWFFSH